MKKVVRTKVSITKDARTIVVKPKAVRKNMLEQKLFSGKLFIRKLAS